MLQSIMLVQFFIQRSNHSYRFILWEFAFKSVDNELTRCVLSALNDFMRNGIVAKEIDINGCEFTLFYPDNTTEEELVLYDDRIALARGYGFFDPQSPMEPGTTQLNFDYNNLVFWLQRDKEEECLLNLFNQAVVDSKRNFCIFPPPPPFSN